MGFIRDCFTGKDSYADNYADRERQREKNRSAMDDDPVFGSILIIVLSLGVGVVTHGIGFFPFLIWALWLGFKPYRS